MKEHLLLPDEPSPDLVDRVVNEGYAPDPTDEELIRLGREIHDPIALQDFTRVRASRASSWMLTYRNDGLWTNDGIRFQAM